jgi:hypothetical protein
MFVNAILHQEVLFFHENQTKFFVEPCVIPLVIEIDCGYAMGTAV